MGSPTNCLKPLKKLDYLETATVIPNDCHVELRRVELIPGWADSILDIWSDTFSDFVSDCFVTGRVTWCDPFGTSRRSSLLTRAQVGGKKKCH